MEEVKIVTGCRYVFGSGNHVILSDQHYTDKGAERCKFENYWDWMVKLPETEREV